MTYVDTNYFLRYFVRDNESHYRTAKKLFNDAALGKADLYTSTVTIFEVYWTLGSHYRLAKSDIIQTIQDILDMSFLLVDERLVLNKALDIFRVQNISLVDSYYIALAQAKNIDQIKSFDKKLSRTFKQLAGKTPGVDG